MRISRNKKGMLIWAALMLLMLFLIYGYYAADIKDYLKWRDYFARSHISDAHPLVIQHLNQKQYPTPYMVKVLDLGAGNGNETIHLLSQGFDVYAIDFHQTAITRIQSRAHALSNPKLTLIKKYFNDIEWQTLPKFDVMIAINSNSFVPDKDFYPLWKNMYQQLKPGGILIVRLLGEKLQWPNMHSMTLLSKNTVTELVKNYDIISFEEIYNKEQNIIQHAFEIALRKNPKNSGSLATFHPLVRL